MTQVEVDNPKGLREVFTNNADRLSMVLKEKIYANVPIATHLYTIIGGLSSLHLIDIIKPRKATLIDINPVQVEFGKSFIELIRNEPDYLTFWKRYYCRDFGKDIRQLPYTQPDDNWNIDEAFNNVPTVANRLKNAIGTDDLPHKYSVRDGTTHDYFFTYGYIRCLHLAGGLYAYHTVTSNPAYPTCGVHHIYNGHGWHTVSGYSSLREWLLENEVTYINGDVYDQEFEPNSFLYLTNLPGIERQKNDNFVSKNIDRIDSDLWLSGDNYRMSKDGRV